jgi:hypothetical protein
VDGQRVAVGLLKKSSKNPFSGLTITGFVQYFTNIGQIVPEIGGSAGVF